MPWQTDRPLKGLPLRSALASELAELCRLRIAKHMASSQLLGRERGGDGLAFAYGSGRIMSD